MVKALSLLFWRLCRKLASPTKISCQIRKLFFGYILSLCTFLTLDMKSALPNQEAQRLLDAYYAMTPEARAQVLKLAEVMAERHPAQLPRPVLRLVAK